MTPAAEARPYANNFEHLADELRWLDLLIGLRASTLTLQSEWAAEGQVPRAAYITPAEVKWLLGREGRGEDLPSTEAREELTRLRLEIDARENCSEDRRVFLALPQLCRMFALSGFERLALVICLAPELRRKYDRLYAFLQDDIVRQRPSVDLVLDLICDNEEQKWSARKFLSEGAPLRRAELIRSADDPQSPSGSSGAGAISPVGRSHRRVSIGRASCGLTPGRTLQIVAVFGSSGSIRGVGCDRVVQADREPYVAPECRRPEACAVPSRALRRGQVGPGAAGVRAASDVAVDSGRGDANR
ncbi:MAG: hypothetical protein WDO73_04405 [Ignavibacteriota bacterium]